MKEKQILEDVRELLSKTFKLDLNNVCEDSNLKDDLGLDSVDIMDSITLLEEKLQIKLIESINWQDTELQTINDLVKIIETKISKRTDA